MPTITTFTTFSKTPLNSTKNPWPYEPLDPKQGLILFLITLPGTLANVIALLITIKLLRTQLVAPNVLVLGLTLTDLYGITFSTLPTLLCYLHKDWYGGEPMCNFQGVSSMFSPLASGFLATSMAVDRLLAVWKPFLYRTVVTIKKTVVTIGLSWLVSLILALIPLTGVGRFKRNLTGTFCTIDWFAKTTQNVAYSLFFAILGISLVSAVVFCNVKVAYTLIQVRRRRSKGLHGGSQRHTIQPRPSSSQDGIENGGKKKSRSSSDEMEIQFAKTVGVISLLFVICWLPFMIRIISNISGWWTNPWADVQVSRLLILNFLLDPFLYTLSRKQCRNILKDWFCCCFLSKKKMSCRPKGRPGKSGSFTSSSHQDVSKTMSSTGSSQASTPVVVRNRTEPKAESNDSNEKGVKDEPSNHAHFGDSGCNEHIPLVQTGKLLSPTLSVIVTNESHKDEKTPYSFNNDVFLRTFSLQERKGSQMVETELGNANRAISVPNVAKEEQDVGSGTKVNVGLLYDLSFQREPETLPVKS